MASTNSVLDTFLNLFHCSGDEGGNGENDHGTTTSAGAKDIPTEEIEKNSGGRCPAVVTVYDIKETETTPKISNCPSNATTTTSTTSIYSIPSRDSMMEFREREAAQRSNGSSNFRSTIFASCTSSLPMQFTFDDEHDMVMTYNDDLFNTAI